MFSLVETGFIQNFGTGHRIGTGLEYVIGHTDGRRSAKNVCLAFEKVRGEIGIMRIRFLASAALALSAAATSASAQNKRSGTGSNQQLELSASRQYL